MTLHFAGWDERTLDLAVDRFTTGLDAESAAALEGLARSEDLLEFERAVAAVHLAHLTGLEAPPSGFVRRLEELGRRELAGSRDSGPEAAPGTEPSSLSAAPRAPSPLLVFGGWLVAAAALVLGLLLLREPPTPDASTLRGTLLAEAPDAVRMDWTATADPAAAGATGDVVWSPGRQEGYMRFRGLEPNDPKVSQYQLWIFDPTRADGMDYPVDGGVFDIGAGGEAVVPIDAKLAVGETALFAVTVEAPGGVVVSKRERIVLTAAP